MRYWPARYICSLLFLSGACQHRQEAGNATRKGQTGDNQIETGALFYWPGSSLTQTFGHYEPGKQQLIVDSTTNRSYEVKILDTCLDIVAQDDTVLATCNDVAYGKRPITRLLGSTKPLRFKYTKGKDGKEQLLISEVPDRNGRASARRAVVLELAIFPVDE